VLTVAVYNRGGLRLGPRPEDQRLYGAKDGLTEDVRAFIEPTPGTLWAGTRFGLFESTAGAPFKKTLPLASGFVMGFFRAPDRAGMPGRWYAATSTEGVFVREGDAWRPVPEINGALDGVHVRGMTWLKSGELWVANLRGITVFPVDGPPRRLGASQEPALPESVNTVLAVGDAIWAGGTGGIAIREAGRWRRQGEEDGLPGTTIYSLALDADGSVWAGGSGGVGRYRDGSWKVWDSRSGLLQDESNLGGLLVDASGVWVGTMSGLAHFDPSVSEIRAPKLHLSWRSTPPLDAEGRARLGPQDRGLHLRWSAPWLEPYPVQYRVNVPRLHDGWGEPTGEDRLDVENLAAGLWQVQVQARVEGTGAWSVPLSLPVFVAPHWYETWPARVLFGALVAGLGYAVVRIRLRALRRHAATLETTVRERTTELAVKVEQLAAANRAKSAFLASMSHELRTPLNGVLGFAQILGRRPGRDSEDRHGLSVILNSGEHLLRLINDVLSLSKIEAGRLTVDAIAFDARALVVDVGEMLRPRAEEKGLRLSIDVVDGWPHAVRGDDGKLRQILLNLLGNAVKFTSAGEVTLRASWSAGEASFSITDTGPGIAADDIGRLFEPFVQAEAGQALREGTGLGLALSRQLARLMGGDITLASTPGRGSRFDVRIALPEASEGTIEARPERRVIGLAPGQGEIRVLVVDDVEVNREVLSRLLSSVGFAVREARDGTQAIELWRAWQPRLIWMDRRMPGIDGLEATRRIRAEEASTGRPRIPILATSASVLNHEQGEVLVAGCDDFVGKPFRASDIFRKMSERLGVRYTYEVERPGPMPLRDRAAVRPRSDDSTEAEPAVLLVDDDRICREVGHELLSQQGVRVTTAASGTEALALLAGQGFDLVLMDLRMPGLSGKETARQLASNRRGRRSPVVAMSADPLDRERAALAADGFDDVLDKPLEPSALAALLRRWGVAPAGVAKGR